jgi:uncharacterized membrane protein (DUF2068 family)
METALPSPAVSGAAKQRAPTLYLIIGLKVLKGFILLLLALGVYSLSDNNLTDEFRQFLQFIHIDPERKFFMELARSLEKITPSNMLWVSAITVLYSFFSLVEGCGLIFRVTWAGWLAIGESMFFIPIEIYELMRHFSIKVLIILGINIFICWYLLQNRRRLFHHHLAVPDADPPNASLNK